MPSSSFIALVSFRSSRLSYSGTYVHRPHHYNFPTATSPSSSSRASLTFPLAHSGDGHLTSSQSACGSIRSTRRARCTSRKWNEPTAQRPNRSNSAQPGIYLAEPVDGVAAAQELSKDHSAALRGPDSHDVSTAGGRAGGVGSTGSVLRVQRGRRASCNACARIQQSLTSAQTMLGLMYRAAGRPNRHARMAAEISQAC